MNDTSKSSSSTKTAKPAPESWLKLKTRLGLAMDTVYDMDVNDPGELVPDNLKALHTFNCPNGLRMEVCAIRSYGQGARGQEGIRFIIFPASTNLCCPVSVHMAAGEAMSQLLPNLWHHDDYLLSHLPLFREPTTLARKKANLPPWGLELIYDLQLRDKV